MSIPLDRLYHYIESVAKNICGDRVVIYRFYPHGSKKIENLTNLQGNLTLEQKYLYLPIYCNDQEPLNYNLYSSYIGISDELAQLFKKYKVQFPSFNFRGQITSVWDWALLLHSEQRSYQVKKYQDTQFITVYYWSHAVLALDWFRYAKYAQFKKQTEKIFLIYNRAWSGTREYRLKFAEYLIHHDLVSQCHATVSPLDPETNIHYDQHNFLNPLWHPTIKIEQFFPISTAKSYYSADFDIDDYNSTEIEIVLETLFDDTRLHLTEKSLRPIACAQPFILAGTSGSLEYLRNYGFKTYSEIWDESYDQIVNADKRLQAIASLMQKISQWDPDTKVRKMQQANKIANYNRQHFFSDAFNQQIFNELKINLQAGLEKIETINTGSLCLERKEIFAANPELIEKFGIKDRTFATQVFETAQKYHQRTIKPLTS
jgi:hypothetical protein